MAAINVVAALEDLQIKSGPYQNGFEIAPNGRMSWYLVNLGLAGAVPSLTLDQCNDLVLPYLNLYIANLKANYTIDDVNFPEGRANPSNFVLQPSDSDDSYAATFFSLVDAYTTRTLNTGFVTANAAFLANMAGANHVDNRKSNGLVSVFQPPRRESYDVALLMDNCEVVKGLRDLLHVLARIGIGNSFILDCANEVALAIEQLWSPAAFAYRWADINTTTGSTFYPDCTAQVFPQLNTIYESSPHWPRAYRYLNAFCPGWEFGGYDPFPWMLLGRVAVMQGQLGKARRQIQHCENLFVSNRALVTINELGWYSLTKPLV